MNQGIYKITNTINDHFYIGSAVNLKRRRIRHFSELRNQKHNNKHLQAAWNKYGENAFTFTVLEFVADSQKLHEAEDHWLREHVGKQYCYNIGMAAIAPMLGMSGEKSPTWGYKHTEETRAKIGAAGKGRKPSAETLAKRSAKLKGRVISEEQRRQISETLSGEGNFWYGKKRPEHGAKVSKTVVLKSCVGDIVYESISALREATGMTPTTVNRALKSGKPISRGNFIGFSIRYVDT